MVIINKYIGRVLTLSFFVWLVGACASKPVEIEPISGVETYDATENEDNSVEFDTEFEPLFCNRIECDLAHHNENEIDFLVRINNVNNAQYIDSFFSAVRPDYPERSDNLVPLKNGSIKKIREWMYEIFTADKYKEHWNKVAFTGSCWKTFTGKNNKPLVTTGVMVAALTNVANSCQRELDLYSYKFVKDEKVLLIRHSQELFCRKNNNISCDDESEAVEVVEFVCISSIQSEDVFYTANVAPTPNYDPSDLDKRDANCNVIISYMVELLKVYSSNLQITDPIAAYHRGNIPYLPEVSE